MINYNDGKWHPIPNEKPKEVHDYSQVEVVWREVGCIKAYIDAAGSIYWGEEKGVEDIAFRVVKEYREPREFWVNEYGSEMGGCHPSKEEADLRASPGRTGCTHVREVIE